MHAAVAGGQQLGFDVVIGRYGLTPQHAQAQFDEARSVGFRLMGKGADERAARTGQLSKREWEPVICTLAHKYYFY